MEKEKIQKEIRIEATGYLRQNFKLMGFTSTTKPGLPNTCWYQCYRLFPYYYIVPLLKDILTMAHRGRIHTGKE